MCLIALAYKSHPRYPLIVAANRDEFLERPTLPGHFWPDATHVLAGRDSRAGGTWMEITTHGRFAALTNYRDLHRPPMQGPSRGLLVRAALEEDFQPDSTPYEGYNLLYGAIDALRYRSNITGADEALQPGIHGLSNAVLDTPWPKVVRAKELLARIVAAPELIAEDLFELLDDRGLAPDSALPRTGVGLDRERALSAIRITMPGYGTRCSTVLCVDTNGEVSFEERTHLDGTVVNHRFSVV